MTTTIEVENLKINGVLTNKGCVPLSITFKKTIDDNTSQVKTIYNNLDGIVSEPLIYSDNNLFINMMAWSKSENMGCGVIAYNYVRIDKKTNTSTKKLYLDKVKIKKISYKCHCHGICLENFSCIGICKKMCECNGISLPIINEKTFIPFEICEGHCYDSDKYISISSYSDYIKYCKIPYIFRYKHEYINKDMEIDFKKYITDNFNSTIDSKYKFSIENNMMKIGIEGDYPLNKQILDLCKKFYGIITQITFNTCSDTVMEDITMLKEMLHGYGEIDVNFKYIV
jgi:hypothetical protein